MFAHVVSIICEEQEEIPIATTKIRALHIGKGKTIAQSLTERIDYIKNPDKTENGTYISAFACDPHTADAEFLFYNRQYHAITGRDKKYDHTMRKEVIAYQVWQSFKPGELTAEEANKIGYEFASRFLKGKHAFIVCTHTDRRHIHNHILWDATTLDCQNKFRDFHRSGQAIRKLSDLICAEHRLSVIQNPQQRSTVSFDQWIGEKKQPSHREVLRNTIDEIIAKNPHSFEEFLRMLEKSGYRIKFGKHLTICKDGQKNIRMNSIGDGYSEDEIRAVIDGKRSHIPKKKRNPVKPQKTSLLIDIQAKLEAGKGQGYVNWAANFNLKQMSKTVLYLQEHDFADMKSFNNAADEAVRNYRELNDKIKTAEKRMAEINVLKQHIINYSKTKSVFDGYKASKYSNRYYAEHESDIVIHRAAKKLFNELGLQKLPTVRSLQTEYASLLSEKKAAYTKLQDARDEMRELTIHRENLRIILGSDDRTAGKEKEHGRG